MFWYEEEVKGLERQIATLQYEPKLVFYGSSSLRLWEGINGDFEQYKPLNLGFGGSTLEACVYFFKRIMKPLNPLHLVIYAGDNDLGDGRTPAMVHLYFNELCRLIDESFGSLSVTFISIKPSLSRWDIRQQIQAANCLIEENIRGRPSMHYVDLYHKMIGSNGFPIIDLYDADGLHLSKKGYSLWKEVLLTHISLKVDSSLMKEG